MPAFYIIIAILLVIAFFAFSKFYKSIGKGAGNIIKNTINTINDEDKNYDNSIISADDLREIRDSIQKEKPDIIAPYCKAICEDIRKLIESGEYVDKYITKIPKELESRVDDICKYLRRYGYDVLISEKIDPSIIETDTYIQLTILL